MIKSTMRQSKRQKFNYFLSFSDKDFPELVVLNLLQQETKESARKLIIGGINVISKN